MVAVVTGTWCPNCHDEAQFLVSSTEVPRPRARDRGAGLRRAGAARRRIQAGRVPSSRSTASSTPYLIAGCPVEMWEKVPQADNLNSWPTTFFVGRDGRVKKIHAGFAAPPAARFHDQVTEEFVSTMERLLAENTTASR